jgi:hypothetical protein
MPPAEVDPFELPDWLAEGEVLWQATDERTQQDANGTIHGRVSPLAGGETLTVDLLAVDVSWPKPVSAPRRPSSANDGSVSPIALAAVATPTAVRLR